MPVDTQRTAELLRTFDFTTLFVDELGWDRCVSRPTFLDIEGAAYQLDPIAEKRGVQVLRCTPNSPAGFPPYRVRQLVDRHVRKRVYEHLIIFVDSSRATQVWQWVSKEPGKAAAYREHHYDTSQAGTSLVQKLAQIAFPLNEEEALTLTGVTLRLRDALDRDRVTKRFYERFKIEQAAFQDRIEGIDDAGDRAWFSSVTMNRLMFVYFIQKKGFLDDDLSYLRTKMDEVAQRRGADKFLTFYRHFLVRLFHEGLGSREHARELDALLGTVPYLNGGLFDVHLLESTYQGIDVPDAAFERLFNFFDEYQWHLDDRPLADDNEINPDVLGYIFEKYVNQKDLGAFYTREDVTEYIASRTIIPAVLDRAEEACAIAFRPDGLVWRLLRDEPTAYMNSTLRHGLERALPVEVEEGWTTFPSPSLLDSPADDAIGLPGETWRASIARRERAENLRDTLSAGGIQSINELLPLDVDLRQLMQDVIETSEGPELVRAIYSAVVSLSVLDPTCGSGAFLFAALEVLEPIYRACLDRMQAFVDDASRAESLYAYEAFTDFRRYLSDVEAHPNARYFILKSAIVNNLFGVDLLEEAVEIAKLRLFLKLVAQIDSASSIEPLPDVDFNIQHGNALVGYATYKHVEKALTSKLDFEGHLTRIGEAAREIEQLFDGFRKMQTAVPLAGVELRMAKCELASRLGALEKELNGYLADQQYPAAASGSGYESWIESHSPFHWFVAFYGIVSEGGFDVVIGNPPYVDYKPKKLGYSVAGYKTQDCRNLYAYTIERSLDLMRAGGRMGMVVPLSLTFSRDFLSLRRLLLEKSRVLEHSSYDNIPDRLFTGAKESDNTSKANQQRITLFVMQQGEVAPTVWSTALMRWRASERFRLFDELAHTDVSDVTDAQAWPKLGSERLRAFLVRWQSNGGRLGAYFKKSGPATLVVPQAAGYYLAAYPLEMERTKQTTLHFSSASDRDLAMVLINSNVFFWFWRVYGDAFDVTSGLLGQCPVFTPQDDAHLALAAALHAAVEECTVYKAYRGVQVPNVNFNKRMDLLCAIDDWIIRSVAPDLGVTSEDFLWAKSSSCFKLAVAKSAAFPEPLAHLSRVSEPVAGD